MKITKIYQEQGWRYGVATLSIEIPGFAPVTMGEVIVDPQFWKEGDEIDLNQYQYTTRSIERVNSDGETFTVTRYIVTGVKA